MIDWSDPEDLLGLLAEYVRDELQNEHRDRERADFLRDLSSAVQALASRADEPARQSLDQLREIHDAQPAEFADDPVLVHVRDCIEELASCSS